MKKANIIQILLLNSYCLITSLFCAITLLPFLTYGSVGYFASSIAIFIYNTIDDIAEEDVYVNEYKESYKIKAILTRLFLGYITLICHHFYILGIINIVNYIQK